MKADLCDSLCMVIYGDGVSKGASKIFCTYAPWYLLYAPNPHLDPIDFGAFND